MSRKRIFDIDMPEVAAPPPRELTRVRGPMATAIGETAAALDDRRAAETAIRAENDALAHEYANARRLGLVMENAPVHLISTAKLTRDRRVEAIDRDLDELKASIREIGLSNPIRVERVPSETGGHDGYELIQGLRRLTAFRALLTETGDEKWSTIPATLVQPGESMEGLYRRMVDENLVRKDVSFAEMAMLAEAYAADPETEAEDADAAVKTLFKSANYQKRSYIRAFADLMARLGDRLEHPEAISRNLGLALRTRLEGSSARQEALRTALADLGPERSVEAEIALLRRFSEGEAAPAAAPTVSGGVEAPSTVSAGPVSVGAGAAPAQARFTVPRPEGETRCAVKGGRLELRGAEDLAAYGPDALARAVEAFYRALET